MSERSILSRLVTSASSHHDPSGIASGQQFPRGYSGGQLAGAYGANFASFRPQYSVPGQVSYRILLVCFGSGFIFTDPDPGFFPNPDPDLGNKKLIF